MKNNTEKSRATYCLEISDVPKISDAKLKKAFMNFLKQPFDYRKQFVQSKYTAGFDGYSYQGQLDSLNQYDTDMLHSFVISDFQKINELPIAFHDFMFTEWNTLINSVQKIEKKALKELNNPALSELYDESIGYMISCNFYPKTKQLKQTAKDHTRLSSHKDISLFTVFPFGIDKGLFYKDENDTIIELGKKDDPVLFSGYFLEWFSNGENSGLQHQVNLPDSNNETRFSFSFFSIPKPNANLKKFDIEVTSEEYYQKYLSLF